jgi:hypothetical protein
MGAYFKMDLKEIGWETRAGLISLMKGTSDGLLWLK